MVLVKLSSSSLTLCACVPPFYARIFFSLLHGDDELRIRCNVWSFSLGLAWTAMGGEIMFVEATRMGGEGKITLTGQLGRSITSWLFCRIS